MRYVHTNKDGSIGIWATVPIKVIRHATEELPEAEFKVLGVRRKNDKCYLYGFSNDDEVGFECEVGGNDYDVSDMPVDRVAGYTFVFPDFETFILAKMHPDQREKVASWRVVKRDEFIEDRTYRGAWIDNGKIDHHIGKAKEIHKDILRAKRKPMLEALDTEYMRAIEKGDKAEQKKIADRKQELRDITKHPDIESAETVEDLKKIVIE